MRIGGALGLKLKHIEKAGEVYRFHVYANSPERYVCFCSREASQAIDLYLKDRESCFEKLTPESFLFRSVYRRVRKTSEQEKEPASVTVGSIQSAMTYALVRAGLRALTDNENKAFAKGRHEVMLVHGLRKFAEGEMVKAGLPALIIDRLLGHDTGLHASYWKPSEVELLQHYLKVEGRLCIASTFVQEAEIKELKGNLQARIDRQDEVLKGIAIRLKNASRVQANPLIIDWLAEDLADVSGGNLEGQGFWREGQRVDPSMAT
jgi:hypothetical protein